MGNATERAKAVADRVAPSNDEDGVAQVLEAELF
jgi:hydroxymethylpyrimidine pyrophosphatase-like HAD family hydrolase